MKFLLYNIAYGTGSPGGVYRRLWTTHRYLRTPSFLFDRIVNFITAQSPDIVALVETDRGSVRTAGNNQVAMLAEGMNLSSWSATKYKPESLLSRMPFWKYQSNAILAMDLSLEEKYLDFFPCGTKKLIIYAQIKGIIFVLVHLALGYRTRKKQIEYLDQTLPFDKPLIICGDFNTFRGEAEIKDFLERRNLSNANRTNIPTFPSWAPQYELDYVLFSPHIQINEFEVPEIQHSDHLPLIVDFDLIPSLCDPDKKNWELL